MQVNGRSDYTVDNGSKPAQGLFMAVHEFLSELKWMLCGEAGQEVEERYRDFLMWKGRATETERMPSLVVGNTELAGGKLNNRNRFPKPNF